MSGPDRKGPKRATALRYDQGAGGAPKVVATGAGHVAERILAAARESGVPVREEPELAAALSRLALDEEIPPELFEAVAQTLVWAYGLRRPGPRR